MEARRRGRRTIGKRRGMFNKKAIAAFKPRPQKSLYDADSWVKIQQRAPILTALSPNPSYIQMGTDIATSINSDYTFLDAPEYAAYFLLYQLAEVRGMKMEVNMAQITLNAGSSLHGLTIYAGPASGVPTGA